MLLATFVWALKGGLVEYTLCETILYTLLALRFGTCSLTFPADSDTLIIARTTDDARVTICTGIWAMCYQIATGADWSDLFEPLFICA